MTYHRSDLKKWADIFSVGANIPQGPITVFADLNE